MVLPKKAGEAKRGYVKTSDRTRGDAKPKPAEQTSKLLQFGFTTKPKPCESAAGETPPSKTATPSESSSATPIATQQASAGNGTSPGTNTRAGPDAATNELAELSVGDYVIRRNELHIVVGIDVSLTPPSYTVKNEATGDLVDTERTLLSLPKPQAAATVTDTRGGTGGGSAIRNVPAAQKNPNWNFDCKVRCPNPGCKQSNKGIPSAQRQEISTTTPFGKWLIQETNQFSIGTDQWCCTACYLRSVSSKKRMTEDDMAQILLDRQWESCPADSTAKLFKTGLKKRIKSWLSSFSSQEKKRVSHVSLASKQKCDMAADVAAVVHSLMPDVIADMEIEAGDDPTEAEKLTPMMPVSSLPKEPKKKTAKSKPKHPEEPTRATAAAIQPAAAKAASKRPPPPIPVTSTVTKGGRTVKPNSLVNFEPT